MSEVVPQASFNTTIYRTGTTKGSLSNEDPCESISNLLSTDFFLPRTAKRVAQYNACVAASRNTPSRRATLRVISRKMLRWRNSTTPKESPAWHVRLFCSISSLYGQISLGKTDDLGFWIFGSHGIHIQTRDMPVIFITNDMMMQPQGAWI